MWTTYNIKKWTNYKMWTNYKIKKWEVDLSLCVQFSVTSLHTLSHTYLPTYLHTYIPYKLNKSANLLGGEKGNFGCWHAVWLILKVNKSALLLEKITTNKFYVISKFKRRGCLGEYKKETYKTKFHFNLHLPLVLESALNVKRS